MKKICQKCEHEVPDNEIISFRVRLKGGTTEKPQLFEHKNCGGEVIEDKESNAKKLQVK